VGRLGGSESSNDSSDSGGLIDVIESGGEDHLDVSDSDDEDGKNGDTLRKDDGSQAAGDVNRTSTLATTKVCGRAVLNEPFDLMYPLTQAASKAVENGGSSAARLNE
jgi:protein SDA1